MLLMKTFANLIRFQILLFLIVFITATLAFFTGLFAAITFILFWIS